MINALMNGATMPSINDVPIPFQNASVVAPAPVVPAPAPDAEPSLPDPSSFAGQFMAQVPSGTTPAHVYLVDSLAKASGGTGGRDDMFAKGAQGLTFGQQMQGQVADNVQGAADALTEHTRNLDDDAFQTYLARLQDLSAHPPAPRGYAPLVAPSALQLGVAGLAAALMPKFALQSLAAPFQAQLQRQAIDSRVIQAQDVAARQAYEGQIQGTRAALDAVQRRAANQNTVAGALARVGITEAGKDARSAAGQATKIQLGQLSADTRTAIARTIAQNHELAQAVRLFGQTAPADKPALAASYAAQGLPLFGTMDPEVIQHFADLTDKDLLAEAKIGSVNAGTAQKVAQTGLIAAKTATENQTRAGKVSNLLKTGNLLDARAEAQRSLTDLNDLRTNLLPAETNALIDQREAAAAKSRKEANDAYAGTTGRGNATALGWQKLDLKLQDAQDKTSSSLEGLVAQRNAINAEVQSLRQRFKALPEDSDGDAARKAINARIVKLNDGLDKIDAVATERRSYLQRLQGQRDHVAQLSANAPPAPSAPTPSASAPSSASVMGFSPYDADERAYLQKAQQALASGRYDATRLQQTVAQTIAAHRKAKGYAH